MYTDAIQNEIEAKGFTAPYVTPAAVESEIVSEHFFTALDGVFGAYRTHGGVYQGTAPTEQSSTALSLLTFCVLVLRNGFTVTGESACVSPENFDEELGRKIARQNAVSKIWPLLGFSMRSALAQTEITSLEPVEA